MHCKNCKGLLIQCSETCMVCGRPNPAFVPRVVQFTDPIPFRQPRVHTRDTSSRIHFVLTPNGRRVY